MRHAPQLADTQGLQHHQVASRSDRPTATSAAFERSDHAAEGGWGEAQRVCNIIKEQAGATDSPPRVRHLSAATMPPRADEASRRGFATSSGSVPECPTYRHKVAI